MLSTRCKRAQLRVRAAIVERPEHFLYSSAMNYAGEKGLLDVILLNLGVTL